MLDGTGQLREVLDVLLSVSLSGTFFPQVSVLIFVSVLSVLLFHRFANSMTLPGFDGEEKCPLDCG